MIKERGDKIKNLIREIQKEYIAYYNEARKSGYTMTENQYYKASKNLDEFEKWFISCNNAMVRQEELLNSNSKEEDLFKSRF